MKTTLQRLIPSGPTLLVAGVLAGVLLPALADAVRPMMAGAIFVFVLGTMLRVDGDAFVAALRRPAVAILLPGVVMLACPLLAGLAAQAAGLAPELKLALVLAASAPPAGGTAAVARMLGLDPTVPLAVTLLSMLMAPLTVPVIAAWFADIALDPLAIALRLFILIGAAGAVTLLLRRHAPAQLARHAGVVDAMVLVAMVVFAIATMAGVRAQIETRPLTALAYVGLAFACNIAMQLVGMLVLPGCLRERLTIGLIVGNRNIGLVWSALGAAVSPPMALFFAATQFPIYMLPRLIGQLVRGRRGREPAAPIPSAPDSQ